MRSTDARRRRQSGQALVEPLVASGLLAVTVVVGLAALGISNVASKRAVRTAWGLCLVRMEADAVRVGAWSDGGYYALDPNLAISATLQTGSPAPPAPGAVQAVTVKALDPDTRQPITQITILKVYGLQGPASTGTLAGDNSGDDSSLPSPRQGCPSP